MNVDDVGFLRKLVAHLLNRCSVLYAQCICVVLHVAWRKMLKGACAHPFISLLPKN